MNPAQGLLAASITATLPLIDRTGLVVPTLNASRYWADLEKAILRQGIAPEHVLIVDSSSSDDTALLARRAGFRVKVIQAALFRHGATRQYAAELLPWAEVLVYITQDALLCGENSLECMLKAFQTEQVGACYGRQLARTEAGPIEQHARLFNYPALSSLRTFDDRHKIGIRAAFFSNSFAAYRRTAFEEVGGFPLNTIVSEDVSVAARMLVAGWAVAYQADATAIHSHGFTLGEEFSRYFDIGVHHAREPWILETFGRAAGEGKAFVISEASFLLKRRPSLIPWSIVRTANKLFAYHLGKYERFVPFALKRAVSAQKGFWLEERGVHAVYEIPQHNAEVPAAAARTAD